MQFQKVWGGRKTRNSKALDEDDPVRFLGTGEKAGHATTRATRRMIRLLKGSAREIWLKNSKVVYTHEQVSNNRE